MKVKIFPASEHIKVNPNILPFLVGLGILEANPTTGQLELSDQLIQINMAICPQCHTFLWSQHRHDFVACDCPEEEGIYIDGGTDYQRIGGGIDRIILPRKGTK